LEDPREDRRDALGDLVTGIVMLVVVAVGTWSLMTTLQGTVRNYAQLFAARVGVGVGEAGCRGAALFAGLAAGVYTDLEDLPAPDAD